MKIAAAYIRVSTDDQLEYSPDSQLKHIRVFAKRNNYILPEDYIFIDEGISGKTATKRPAFMRMIGIAKTKPKPFDAILVWKFSRFARNRQDSVSYKSILRIDCGIDVISISEQLSNDKSSIILESVYEAWDEYYSINLAEEVKRGMTEKANRGEPLCAPAFGYLMKDKQYFPHPEQAPIVKEIFNKFINGNNINEITRWLQNLGVKTIRGNSPDRRFVEYILHNPVYAGKIRWCPDGKAASKRDYYNESFIIVDGKHEAIITQEAFDKAEAILSENRKKFRKYQRQNQNVDFMLKGLLRCGNCGATLVHLSTACPSVQCHNYSGSRGCNVSHSLSIKKANAIIIDLLKQAYENETFNIEPAEPKKNDETQSLEALLKREQQKLVKIREAYTTGVDTLEEYKEQKEQINRTIATIEKEMQKSKPNTKAPSAKGYKKKVKKVIDILEAPDASEQMKNDALRTIISRIVYNKTATPPTLDLYFYS